MSSLSFKIFFSFVHSKDPHQGTVQNRGRRSEGGRSELEYDWSKVFHPNARTSMKIFTLYSVAHTDSQRLARLFIEIRLLVRTIELLD